MLKRKLSPVHPGEILKEDFINPRGLTITAVATGLGITRANLSAIVNGHAGISPQMAVKLSQAFGNSTQFWVNLQKNYDIWHAEKSVDRKLVRQFEAGNYQPA